MTRPYFAEPLSYVNVPSGANRPLFSKHNHDPTPTYDGGIHFHFNVAWLQCDMA